MHRAPANLFLALTAAWWLAPCRLMAAETIESVLASRQPDSAADENAANVLWIERFSTPQAPPPTSKQTSGNALSALGWQGGNAEENKHDHVILTENGKNFVRSSYLPGTEANYLYKEVDWDSSVYPYLRWQWRVRKFPKGARILNPKLSDAGAQIYVLWRFFPRYFVLKYFWSAGAEEPVDSTFKDGNVFTGFLFGRVLRAGPPLNEWKTETRNIAEDFVAAFKQAPPGKVKAIAILADGDETKSPSEADFADFHALKKP